MSGEDSNAKDLIEQTKDVIGKEKPRPSKVKGNAGILDEFTWNVLNRALVRKDEEVETGDCGLVEEAYDQTEWGGIGVIRDEEDDQDYSHIVVAVFNDDYDFLWSGEPKDNEEGVEYSIGIGRDWVQFDTDIHEDPESLLQEAEEYADEEMTASAEFWREKSRIQKMIEYIVN